MAATPDGIAQQYPLLIEIKCPYSRKIEHNIPSYYYPQVQCQMAVCNISQTHFVQYYPPSMYRRGMIDIIVINFDKIWWTKALTMILNFWEDVKAHYNDIGKPIGTQTLDWKSKQSVSRKTQKRKRVVSLASGSSMLDSPGLLSMQMVQRSKANLNVPCKIDFASITIEDPNDFVGCFDPSDGLIQFDMAAVRSVPTE